MASKEALPYGVPRAASWARQTFLPFGHVLFPVEIHLKGDGIIRSQELLKDGYGLVIVFNHFSLRDGPQVIADVICGNGLLRERRIVAPVAYHQSGDNIRRLAKLFGIELMPIVTKETIAKGKNDRFPLGHGKFDYLREAVRTLRDGGIVILAPQGTRKNRLEDSPEIRPVGILLSRCERRQIDKVGLLCVGVGLAGVEDYSLSVNRGYNPRATYRLKIGSCKTKQEMLAEAGSFKEVDCLVLNQLRDLVPEAYR